MTRDNMLEGDRGTSALARRLGLSRAPAPLRIQVPAHVAANFEGLVARVDDTDAPGGRGHLWKVVRTFDDPATWTEPGVRHLAADGTRRARVPHRRPPRPVGAVRPDRRPRRGRQPMGAVPSSPTCGST